MDKTHRSLRTLLAGLMLVGAPLSAGLAAGLGPSSAAAEVPKVKKLAMVDMQRVINETKAGKAARAKLEKSSKTKQAKFDKKRSALEAEAAKLGSLSGQELAVAQEKLQRESIELQNMLMALEQELGDQHNKLLETMYANAQTIVADLAKEMGLDLVLVRDPMTVIYAKDGLDITAEVVKRYDAKHPK
ncbi:OmpH family outer membrane protein [Paraliomyxa miuraensis]|uniref:OmpH family outer membrane protein n=1 Tax=Paraliomyxa miuraensis TaxID=376150 RepID=UPI0022599146|nr:OmpH family outer membrane protein [Paraliomyxa miuraensis]MCX4244611.1 OmpH family outer membrane protein [Paraliomyxa miuraensis]